MNNSLTTASQQPNHGINEMSKVLPIAIAIILTNGLVFFTFYKQKSLRNSSNYLLLGLAVCDFLTGAVSIPYYVIFSFEVVPRSMLNDFAYWMVVLQTLVAVSAAYHILVITGERYLAIIKPLKHYLVTKTTVFKVLAGIWIVSAFIATIPFAWRIAQSKIWDITHSVICLVIVFLVPYVFMVYMYAVMFKAVNGRNRPSQHGGSVKRWQTKRSKDRKCITVFAIMAAIYLCCWLPYFTLMLTYKIKAFTKSKDFDVADKITEAFVIIRFITSVTNPLLYTFFKRDIWYALRSLSVRRRKVNFAVPKRSITIRSFSIGYSSRSKSSDSSRSADRGTPNKDLKDNVKMEVEYIVFISSV